MTAANGIPDRDQDGTRPATRQRRSPAAAAGQFLAGARRRSPGVPRQDGAEPVAADGTPSDGAVHEHGDSGGGQPGGSQPPHDVEYHDVVPVVPGERWEAYASFPPVSDSVSAARSFVRETLRRWDAMQVSDDAVLVVSELVTNAIVHAGTAVEVACVRDGGVVRVAVADHHPARQIPAIGLDGLPADEGGRGLMLSTAIAASWGVEYARSRKTVWFALDVPESAAAAVQLAEPVRPSAPTPSLSETAAAGMLRTTVDGTVVACDDNAARMVGVAAAEAVGRGVAELLGVADPGWVEGVLALARWQGVVPQAQDGTGAAGVFASTMRAAGVDGRDEAVWLIVSPELRGLFLPHSGPHDHGATGGVARVAVAGGEGVLVETGQDGATGTTAFGAATPADVLLVPDSTEAPSGLDELLQRGAERARDVFPVDAAYTLLTTDDGTGLVLRGATGLLVTGHPVQPVNGPAVLVPQPVRAPGVRADLPEDGDLPLLVATGMRSLVHVPLMVGGRFIGVFCLASRAPARFGPEDAVALHRVTEAFSLAVEAARLTELDRRRRGTLSFLAEASDLLAGTLDPSRTLAMLGQLVVPRLASWCAVHTVDDQGQSQLAHVWHPDERRLGGLKATLEGTLPPDPGGAPRPAQTLLPPDAEADDPVGARRRAAVQAAEKVTADDLATVRTELRDSEVIGLPLSARGRRLGVLTLGRPHHDPFRPDLVTLAEDISRRAALALDNARLYSDQVAASQALQRSLLPPALPEIPGVDRAVHYQAAGEGNEVGGDFYDLFTARRGYWAFAIGDVCGTGPQAAAVTGLARHTLRLLARRGEAIPEVLSQLNTAILDEGRRETDGAASGDDTSRFMTLLYGELRPRRRGGVRLTLASAGHPLPMRLRPDGTVESVCTPQPLLGVMDDLEFTTETVLLDPGDVLLCVTDGVTERREGTRMLGEDGLAEVLSGCRGLSAAAVATRVKRAVEAFAPTPASDDMAILVLRASGLPRRSAPWGPVQGPAPRTGAPGGS